MDYFPSFNLTETELSWIIDALVSGDGEKSELLNNIPESELEGILTRLQERLKQRKEQEEHAEKAEIPELWGITEEVLKFEKAIGLPPLIYFSKPFIREKDYF